MKRFHFGLQQVMEWRDRRAEQERNALEQLHATRNKLELERDALTKQISVSHSACAVAGGSSSDDLRHLAGFLDALRTRESRVKETVAQCHSKIGEQTSRCLQADRDHELLVRLRDRQLATWKYELNRETEASAADSWMAGRAREKVRSNSGEPV